MKKVKELWTTKECAYDCISSLAKILEKEVEIMLMIQKFVKSFIKKAKIK